jgi:hypothetical protein
MSHKRIQSRCLVVDASVARAAGPFESQHPIGAHCRDFLIAIRGICLHVAWSESIKIEWDKHQGSFASQWRVSMMNLKKLRPITNERLELFRAAIAEQSQDNNVAAIMLKDAHLVEAAWACDRRVASLDDTVRGHFRYLASAFDALRTIIWLNPAIEEEQVLEWLKSGAPAQRHRRLKR